jgi:hypothetical protein
VHTDFTRYQNLEVAEIVDLLARRREEFDIVYVSGDTDSFARPRTERGIDLLRGLSDLKCDVLFTTRASLKSDAISHIGEVSTKIRKNGNLLFGCISISQLRSAPHVEPKPVPTAEERIGVLRELNEAGLVSVLAVRPFLPIVPPAEYCEIVELCKDFSDLVLGEVWYCDKGGILEDLVLGKGNRLREDFVEKTMDFDSNKKVWKVYLGSETEARVRQLCDKLALPFFMRSRPAIEHIRRKYGK